MKMALWLSFLPTLDQDTYNMSRFAFESITNDNSGQLDREEMLLALEDLKLRVHDLNFTADDVIETFNKLDLDKTGLITHSMFVVATIDRSLLGDEILMRLFKDLDSLQEDFLTKESIKFALRRKGIEISMESIRSFLKKASIGDDDHIDFEKFKSLILN